MKKLLFVLAVIAAGCDPQYKVDYDKKRLELEIKERELNYLRELHYFKNDTSSKCNPRFYDLMVR